MAQYDDYMSDFALVQMGEKPCVIIERRKSPKAYLVALSNVRRDGSHYVDLMLADSSGQRHPALIIGEPEVTHKMIEVIGGRDVFTREQFQLRVGALLGYSFDDCVEFVRSPLSLTCGCQLCGGPTPESRTDDAATAARMINRGGA